MNAVPAEVPDRLTTANIWQGELYAGHAVDKRWLIAAGKTTDIASYQSVNDIDQHEKLFKRVSLCRI